MSSLLPRTKTDAQRDAQCLIERISREHTLGGTIIGTRFELLVSSCLEILSSQLYQKSTHFLLELIQNADDNTYNCLVPKLIFSYKPGSLRIDCNEAGFSAENVEAICAINQSTKSGKTRDGEYIGEKGIGFKSVFKAADVVWISSREFTFKFDKTKLGFLGMVSPTWADFPEPTEPGFTSIFLQLSKGYEEETLVQELLTFDTNLLIFLRRIQEIEIRVALQDELVREKRIRKIANQQTADCLVLQVREGDKDCTFRYLTKTYVIDDLPKEQKRPGWKQTKILLAFPTARFPEQPDARPQNVYAFLPIRNYGLKFLIQGDFLLTASREDIESTLPWNRKIRDALTHAFLKSIDDFSKGELKYLWPYYLPSTSTAACTFLEPAVASILLQLKESGILESCAGTMVKASSLKHVPLDLFADGEGKPFTLNPLTRASYLSLNYPLWAIEAISSIGVSQLTPREFLADLNSSITQDPTSFRTKPPAWHSQLANTLTKLATDPELLPLIYDLYIIPLHNGEWASAKDTSMFFSRSDSALEIPSGIEVLVVDSATESDLNRRKLFTSLGVKAWEAPEICRLILQVHESPDFDPKRLDVDQLISHAAFLYKASWQPPKSANLWFATMQEERCLGRELYIPGDLKLDSATGRIFAQLQRRFAVIHADYLKAFPSDADWPVWLVRNLGLSNIPRLITPYVCPRPQPRTDHVENLITLPSIADQLGSVNHLPPPKGSNEQLTRGDDARAAQRPTESVNQFVDFHASMDFANPGNGNMDLLEHFEFDSFLHQDAENVNNLEFDTSAPPLTENEVTTSLIAALTSVEDSSITPITKHFSPPLRMMPSDSVADPNDDAQLDALKSNEHEAEFSLSEEFTFMLQKCDSSDVLQLIRDNWVEYSKWISGTHMKWQNSGFIQSCSKLKSRLAACAVSSSQGHVLLQETVLPMIDARLDEGGFIPAVEIEDPQHPEWVILSHFDVVLKGDVHYYIRCLIAISGRPYSDVDTVAYIYEQLEARYKGNEELIRAAFYERDIIFVHSAVWPLPTGWTNMKQCASREINVEAEYPRSSYLFRCLRSPIGDPIAPIIATATSLITSSTKLEDISRLFRDISAALKDVNASKAAELLKSLQIKPIFPVTNGSGKKEFDKLGNTHDKSWFIADRQLIRESFYGKLPLLALPIEDLNQLEAIFYSLRLDSRMLSSLTRNQTRAKGRLAIHWSYTASLRRKTPFIKALIPHSHHDRTTVMRQIDQIRVSIATEISQVFTLSFGGTEIEGNPVPGQVSLSHTECELHITMTEHSAAAKPPPYELVTLISDVCGIKDPSHRALLYTALSSSDVQAVNTNFSQQGIHVKGLMLDKPAGYRAQRGHTLHILSPFWGQFNKKGRSFQGLPMAMRFNNVYDGGRYHNRNPDRRLPIMSLVLADGSASEDVPDRRLVYEPESINGWEHIQYLGQLMVSKLLQTNLGESYDAERDWTSYLRGKCGHAPFTLDEPKVCAAFTLRDLEVRKQLTEFILKYGKSRTPNWKSILHKNTPIYHLDVAPSAGSKISPFVIATAQIERMQQLRFKDDNEENITDVAVLVRVSDLYSEDSAIFDLYVDPWHLLNSADMKLEETWNLRAAIQEKMMTPTKKRRRLDAPSVIWASSTAPAAGQKRVKTRSGQRHRATYIHRPLGSKDTIRLLYLLPGATSDQLQGVITHVPYQAAGVYRALSYVWGTHQRDRQLKTPEGILGITLSLEKALRGLRHKTEPIMLWVDAICINQNDDEEKAKQIRLLPQIFQTASSTYAFLEASDDSDDAIQMLMQVVAKAECDERSKRTRYTACDPALELGDDSELDTRMGEDSNTNDSPSTRHDQYSRDWPDNLPRIPTSWSHRCTPHFDDPRWSSVKALFDLPWFRRVWIIQEIVGAPHVKIVCGKWIIDWNDLHRAVEIIDREVQLSDDDLSHLKTSWDPFLSLSTMREWEARNVRFALIMLLENFRYAESTLCRDRLFALLGLASDGNEAEFEPDYRNETSLESVMLKFASVFVRQGRGMQLLYRAGTNDHSDRFPSWIPDWTVKRPSSLYDSSDGGVSFSASGPQQEKIKHTPETDELIVEGYEVDIVERISEFSNVESEWNKYFEEIDAIIDSATLTRVWDSHEDLKWKVPVAGLLYPKVALSGGLGLQASYKALRDEIKADRKGKGKQRESTLGSGGNSYSTAQNPDGASQKPSATYISALQDTVHGWRFIVTAKGFIGVVPRLTCVGDVIAILKGGQVPFIVKKSATRPEAVRLVGECYVHRMMNGEGLSLPGVVETEFRFH